MPRWRKNGGATMKCTHAGKPLPPQNLESENRPPENRLVPLRAVLKFETRNAARMACAGTSNGRRRK